MNKTKNIIITGGHGRIGSALTEFLINNGHNVLVSDIKPAKKKTIFKNGNYNFIKLDLTKEKNIKKLIKFGKKKFKIIDGLIHLSYPKSKNWGVDLSILKQTDLNQGLINNLGATIILSKNILKTFQQQKKGNLILFSSIYGVFTPRFSDYPKGKIYSPAEYAVMKSGTISFVKYLAKKYQKKGIRINCISPGGIKDGQNTKFIKNYEKNCNSKGLLDPADLNGLVKFLISEDSLYINGQNIIIDDGWSL